MVNYKLSKIYKIVCSLTGKVYVGSTCEPTLAKRLTKHVGNYKCYLKGKYHYVTSFDIIKNNSYEIVLIEIFPCTSKDELHARERYWSNCIDCVNKHKNQGLLKKIGQKEYDKLYRNDPNRHEKIQKYRKNYQIENRDIILKKSNEYRDKNKDEINRRAEEYRKKHKKEIESKGAVKHECICGSMYTRCHKNRHFVSGKHKAYISKLKMGIITCCTFSEFMNFMENK